MVSASKGSMMPAGSLSGCDDATAFSEHSLRSVTASRGFEMPRAGPQELNLGTSVGRALVSNGLPSRDSPGTGSISNLGFIAMRGGAVEMP